MTEKWNLNSVIGSSDTETVKLDFDHTTFRQAKYWASKAMEKHKLEGYLILKSSRNNYHVVFNRSVSWEENLSVVAWVCLLSRSEALKKWLLMQCIKASSTLRVSPKGGKPSPRIVCRQGKQDMQIQSFLHHRNLIKNIIRKLRANPHFLDEENVLEKDFTSFIYHLH